MRRVSFLLYLAKIFFEELIRYLFLCSTTMLKKILKLLLRRNHDLAEATWPKFLTTCIVSSLRYIP